MLLENAISEELDLPEEETHPAPSPPSPPTHRHISGTERDKMLAACTGAILTSLTMTPFDVIKTRLQTQAPREPLFVPSTHLPPPSFSHSTSPWPPPVASTSTAPPPPPSSISQLATNTATCCQKTYFSANTSDRSLLCRFDPRISRSSLPASGTHTATFPQHLHHLAASPAPTPFAISSAAGSAVLATPSPTTCLYPSAIQASQSLPYLAHTPPPRHLTGFWDALIHIVRSEGITALWRGTGPALAMSVPGQVVYMVGYDWGRRTAFARAPEWAVVPPRVGETEARLSPVYLTVVPLFAGALSRTVVAALLSPAELLRTQLQAQTSSSRTSLLSLVQNLRWTTAWKGLGPTLWRDVPFSGIYWAGYEGIKRALTGKGLGEGTGTLGKAGGTDRDDKWKEFGVAFVSGAGSGMIAATLTNPFDVVKTRRQALTAAAHSPSSALPSPKTFSILADIARKEGWRGLTQGLTPRLAKVGPACGLMISVYEVVPSLLHRKHG
ncbi:hypothetical protein JCM21900_006803 [Sporobolomyces salmonicolor]